MGATVPFGGDIDLIGNEIQNVVFQNLSLAPQNPKEGQVYYNTADHTVYVRTNNAWVNALSQGKIYTFSTGLTDTNDTITLNRATASAIGGVIVGANINVNNGTISVADAANTVKGIIRIATDAEATTGTSEVLAVNPKQLATKLTANAAITSGTYTKVTVDTKGLVTSGGTLTASDIPDISSTYVTTASRGQANGVASLDADGKVPAAQLPSYVDDVIDSYIVSGAMAFSAGWLSATSGGSAFTPETGKIYVVLSSGQYQNKTYRWSGATYVEIASSPAQATESVAGIAAIATEAETLAGTNDTKFITPKKLAAYSDASTKITTTTNPALTASGGVCTWTISNTPENALINIYQVSSGNLFITDVTLGSGSITVRFNSTSNIAAGTYKAVIIG